MNLNEVNIIIEFKMDFDEYTLPWLEEVKDKIREQSEITLARMTGVPAVIDLGR